MFHGHRRILLQCCDAGTILVSALVVAQVAGCASSDGASSRQQSQLQQTRIEQTSTAPIVISGTPARDTVGFEQSERQLSEADWQKLTRLGPKPIWEQIRLKQKKQRDHASLAVGGASPVDKRHDAPGTCPSGQPTLDESTLPVQISELPDNKIRIIWTLRSYGGASVSSATDGGTARRKVTATPPDLGPLVAVVTAQAGAGAVVVPLPRENTLVITCDKAARNAVLDVLNRLDVPPRQVEITAKIFEVSRDFDFQYGAQVLLKRLAADNSQTALSTFSTQRFLDAADDQSQFQGSILSLMKRFQDAGVSLDMSFQLLADEGLINVVSAPRMTVAEGQTGYMLAGQEMPIQSSIFNGTTTLTTTTYKPVGVQLYITPQVIGEDRVKLHTVSVVSSVSGFAPLPQITGGHTSPESLVNPIIDSREAETAVTIEDRDTLVISGLRMIRSTTRQNKVPGLGDIPLIGWMFKNHRTQQQVTDLYFFVTPTLLQVADAGY